MIYICFLIAIIFDFTNSSSNDLHPLKLPPDYEDKMKNILPQLLKQMGIPSVFLPTEDGYFLPSLSLFYDGLGYLNFWDKDAFPDACKSKIVEGVTKITKLGTIMCKKKCQEENDDNFNFMRDTLKNFMGDEDENKVELVQDSTQKIYECVAAGDEFQCICTTNDVIKVSPDLQDLVYQFLRKNKTRDILEEVGTMKLMGLIILYIIQKMAKLVKKVILAPILPYKKVYDVIKKVV